MLDNKFQYKLEEQEWDIELRKDHKWESADQRVLIVLQTIPSSSLKAQDILAEGIVQTTMLNSIKYARTEARKFGADPTDTAWALVNWNAWKHFSLKGPAREDAESKFTDRLRKLIKSMKPTHIFISGDKCAAHLLPDIPAAHIPYKRGWIHEYGPKKIPLVSTVDFDKLIQKNAINGNLLGFWCRHLSNLLNEKLPFSLAKVRAEVVYVNTMEKWESLHKRLKKAGPKIRIGLDTETRNLSVLHNTIYTIQFAFSDDPYKGFILPLHHPKTPWDPKEIKMISKGLTEFFQQDASTGPELCTFNGMFDLRVIRAQFGLPIIYLPVWEVMAGEHLLDENVSGLSSVGPPMGGLLATYCRYGNDHYLTAEFSKEERSTLGAVDINKDKEAQLYCATDPVATLAISFAQEKAAANIDLDGTPWAPIFKKHMRHIMSDTAHQLSHLRQDGSLVDRQYLTSLMAQDSPLRKEMDRVARKLRLSKPARRANKQLLRESGLKATSLFGGATAKDKWVLQINKPEHKKVLFFETLGLEPVSETKNGSPAIDKVFIKEYKDKVEEVAILDEWTMRQKLLSTYVKGWFKKLTTNADSITDSFLRPDYAFMGVDTGRLASRNPSLQTIPARGKLSKIIKRMFVAPKGHILVRFDYSAHEVRIWSILSGDKELAQVFRVGQKLRKRLIKALESGELAEILQELKTKGDLHIQNVKRFFNKWVDKSDPLRDAVKAVVFGVLYGLSARSLGKDLGKDEEYAQGLIDKLFDTFKVGGRWVKKIIEMARTKGYTYSALGRRRFLPAVMTGDRGVVNRQIRRGSNAPGQGAASEIGTKASRRIMETYYKQAVPLAQKYLGVSDKDTIIQFNRIVHDASYFAVPYAMVVPFLHVLQWEATYGITKAIEKEIGLKFTIEPEIEMEFGTRDDRSRKWSWQLPELVELLCRSLMDGQELGSVEDAQDAWSKIIAPYYDKKTRKLLQKKWPLLDVSDLDENIRRAFNKGAKSYKVLKAQYLEKDRKVQLEVEKAQKAALKSSKKPK